MATLEPSILTAELRLDVQEFYFRYAECLDGGRLLHWPDFFVDACVYRVTTRRGLRLGPAEDLVNIGGKTAMRDRIVAIGRSEDFEPHAQRHYIANFRVQAPSPEELRIHANFQVLRTYPEQRTEYFVSGTFQDRIAISDGRLHFAEKLCVLDSDLAPESLVYPL
ncbi:MAG: nuclear transport factor 2 family protein [Burkholderiales bacterium]|nr:nuclear transport factor 2 family protein [Burkholderiales bacterium]